MSKKEFVVGIVGVTGAVGEELLRILDERDFPVKRLVPLASARSAGDSIEFKNQKIKVLETTDSVFKDEGIEIAFFSAGGSVSERFAKSAVKAGAIVIDNTSFFRMQKFIPLVVPEVNPEDIKKDFDNYCKSKLLHHTNGACVLAPLHKAFAHDRSRC